jgi:hypothetical protein
MKKIYFILLVLAFLMSTRISTIACFSSDFARQVPQTALQALSKPVSFWVGENQTTEALSQASRLMVNTTTMSPDIPPIVGISSPVSFSVPEPVPSKITEVNTKSIHDALATEIPVSKKNNRNSFALIIGNEDYNSFQAGLSAEANVDFALNDARLFKEYTIKTLGVPEKNIIYLENARSLEMQKAIKKLSLIIKTTQGKANVIVYYAGHGLPDEQTKEPYLIPVDVTGSDLNYGIRLSEFYKDLTEFKANQIVCFFDACFTGGARNQGLIAARGVKIKPVESAINGNLIVLSASSEQQSALPYNAMQHGMFTYFLLKKIQETQGEVSMQELSEFIINEVSLNSLLINNKEQTPKLNKGAFTKTEWANWHLN